MEFGLKFTKTNILILRGLALIYLFAFCSVFDQIELLYAKGGLLPVEKYLDTIKGRFSSFSAFPTIFAYTNQIFYYLFPSVIT